MNNLDNIKALFENYSKEKNFSGVALIKEGNKDIFSYPYGYAHRGYEINNTLSTKIDTTVTILSNTDACDIWDLAFEISKYLGIKIE